MSSTTSALRERRRTRLSWCAAVAVVSLVVLGLTGCAGAEAEHQKSHAASGRGAQAKPKEAKPAAAVKQRTVRKQVKVPFSSQSRSTDTLKKGVSKVSQAGRAGLRVTTFRVTFKNGVQTARKLLKTVVVRKPVPRIVLHGTHVDPPKPTRSCDSNYSGCVPIASDVDCGGGSGNGPAYVYGSVKIVGYDVYDLDADGDGYGCD
ncbi:MAG: hypothetical protein JWN91_1511 [Nocardioides sp.]|nr:hypothetical protein [Nocardioides sp.]